MACPGGCVGGGGEPKTGAVDPDIIQKRVQGIYAIDKVDISAKANVNSRTQPRTHAYTQIKHIHACTHVCMHARTHTQTHTFTHTSTHARTHARSCAPHVHA